MRILLCNDDGIHAPGIHALYEAVREFGDIVVVAPSEEQSAVGHAITVFDPIKMSRITFEDAREAYAVGGTPADCIKLAVTGLLNEPPDLVISGINLGPNAGISVIYSGTVSAATEATILGIPSLAISMGAYHHIHWKTGAQIARTATQLVLEHGLPERTLLNVNVPNAPLDELKGYAITRMARSRYNEVFHERTDPRGNSYFWLDGDMELLEEGDGTDVDALDRGYVSLSPIGIDLTNHAALEALGIWDLPTLNP